MERPELFRKPARGTHPLPSANDAALIRQMFQAAAVDRIYAPLFAARPERASVS